MESPYAGADCDRLPKWSINRAGDFEPLIPSRCFEESSTDSTFKKHESTASTSMGARITTAPPNHPASARAHTLW